MHFVTVKIGEDTFITLKTANYADAEEAMAAIVENKQDFLYELFGGKDLVEDHGNLEQIEISGIWS